MLIWKDEKFRGQLVAFVCIAGPFVLWASGSEATIGMVLVVGACCATGCWSIINRIGKKEDVKNDEPQAIVATK